MFALICIVKFYFYMSISLFGFVNYVRSGLKNDFVVITHWLGVGGEKEKGEGKKIGRDQTREY